MKRVRRVTFLKVAVGAAAGAVNFLYPGLTNATRMGHPESRPPTANGAGEERLVGPDPSFAGGKVVAKTADGVVVQSPVAVRAIRIPAGALVWKEFDVTPDVIQLQDWLDVKGTPLADGSLIAKWIFVNIGRRNGVVGQVSSPSSLTTQDQQGTHTMELSSRLEVISVVDASPLSLAQLTPGTAFGAVGLRLPDGGFRATRIWI